MPETLPSLQRPAPPVNCAKCRLGTLTIPCAEDDVRRILWSTSPARLHRTQVVPGLGPIPCPIMLIGEAPGFYEDREGEPFWPMAPAGRILQAALDEVGLRRDGVYLSNTVKCKPVDNKIDRFPDAIETCRAEYLWPEVEAVRPKVIVCLGKVAAQPFFGSQPSLALRMIRAPDWFTGIRVVEPWNMLVIHAPHPSNIARGNKDARPKLVEALRIAKEVVL